MPAEGFTLLADPSRTYVATICGRQVRLRREMDLATLTWSLTAMEVTPTNTDGIVSYESRHLRTVTRADEQMASRAASAGRALFTILHEDVRKAFGWSDPDVLMTIQLPTLLEGETLATRLPLFPGINSATVTVRRDGDSVRAYLEAITGTPGEDYGGRHIGDTLLLTRPSNVTEVTIMRQHIEAVLVSLNRPWTVPGAAPLTLTTTTPRSTTVPSYFMPGGTSYSPGGAWSSTSWAAWDNEDPPARPRRRPAAKPKEPEPEPVVRPIGRLYDLDD